MPELSEYKQAVARNFSLAASTYDEYAQVQAHAAKRLAEFVASSIRFQPQSIFEVGCGTGLLTSNLAELFAESRIVASDISSCMLQKCRERLEPRDDSRRISFCLADAESLDIGEQFDLLISGLTAQWLDLETCLTAWRHRASTIAFSTLLDGTFSHWYEMLRQVDPSAQLKAHSFLSESQLLDHCRALPDSRVRFQKFSWNQSYSSIREFLIAIKKTGTHTPADLRPDPTLVHRVLATTSGPLVANYHVGLCVISSNIVENS